MSDRYAGPVALLAFLAAAAAWLVVPNLLQAVERGRQKRTMSDLRSLGTAVESYAVDRGFFPAAASLAELEPLIAPTFLKQVPLLDGWEVPLRFASWREEGGALVAGPANGYAIRSAGPDRVFEVEDVTDYRSGSWKDERREDLVFGGFDNRSPPSAAPVALTRR